MPKFEEVDKRLRAVASAMKEKIFPGLGFCILLFEFHKPGVSNYISNAQRKEMITTLREAADRLEAASDWQPGQEN